MASTAATSARSAFSAAGSASLGRRGAGEIAGRVEHFAAQVVGHDETQHLPMGDLIPQAIDRAAGQLDFELIRPSRSISVEVPKQQHAAAIDPPGHPDAAGIGLGPLDDQLVAAHVGAAVPGQFVLAAHVNLVEAAGRNAISIVNR